MKVAVIGSGGRGHAFIWKLSQTVKKEDLFFLPGNPGFEDSHEIDPLNFESLKIFCEQKKIGLLIVGPEAPLDLGIADYFEGSPTKVFGPKKIGARLESSKKFAKEFMKRSEIPTAPFWAFDSIDSASPFIEHLGGDLVLKYDGLAAGKGVVVCDSVEEAMNALDSFQKKWGENCPFLIEEKLKGWEVSLIGLTDGKEIILFPYAKDHKPAFDGDKGPNTGGMGAFTPVPMLTNEMKSTIQEKIVARTLSGLQNEGIEFRGFLYFGLMITESGPQLLEYNVRFGDPEAEVLLPSLETDLLELIQASFNGTLGQMKPKFSKKAFVDVVLTSKGYPGPYPTQIPIHGVEEAKQEALLFHAGTKWNGSALVTSGGRVLNVVGSGQDLHEARESAYHACDKIHFEGKQIRTDIAKGAIQLQ